MGIAGAFPLNPSPGAGPPWTRILRVPWRSHGGWEAEGRHTVLNNMLNFFSTQAEACSSAARQGGARRRPRGNLLCTCFTPSLQLLYSCFTPGRVRAELADARGAIARAEGGAAFARAEAAALRAQVRSRCEAGVRQA